MSGTVQLAAASLLGRLQVQALHGPRVTLTLQRLLPPGLVAAIQASPAVLYCLGVPSCFIVKLLHRPSNARHGFQAASCSCAVSHVSVHAETVCCDIVHTDVSSLPMWLYPGAHIHTAIHPTVCLASACHACLLVLRSSACMSYVSLHKIVCTCVCTCVQERPGFRAAVLGGSRYDR